MQHNGTKHFFFSLALHIIVLAALIMSFTFSSSIPVLENSDKNLAVINAMVMTAPAAPAPTPAKVTPTPLSPPVIKKRVVQAPKPTPAVVKKLQPVQVQPKAIVIPNKKPVPVQKNKIADDLLADLKKQTQREKQARQKAVAAAFAKEMRELSAKSLQQQVSKEQMRIAGARSQQVRGQVDKYKALILQVISQHWLMPPSVDKNLSAELLVRVAPGGVVLDVELIKSSADDSLDRSARAAVFKSSPLPVPSDADAFETFRQFVLKVRPKNFLASDSWVN